jgi:hypothetical protein
VFVILNQTGPSLVLDAPINVYVEVYNKFTEPGFTARDNQGNLINNQVVVTTNMDTAVLGNYSRVYTVTDAFGLRAIAQRSVTVGDSTRPVIAPKGNPYVHQVGTALDLNSVVTVTDNYWPRSFINLEIQGSVDVNSVGSYNVAYKARDNSGNLSNEVVVRIDVRDTKPPTLVLNGFNPTFHEVKTTFNDPWVTVSDNYWPAGTVVVSRKGTLNINVLGTYNLWYIATDPSGNKDSVLRVVNVVDRTKPRIDLLNVNEVNLPRWKEYIDPPVALIDNYNTDKEMRDPKYFTVLIGLPRNTEGKYYGDVPGIYTIRYKLKDLSGNEADDVIRMINVLPANNLDEVMNLDRFMSVYPNPSNGLVNLRLVSPNVDDVQVSVFDILGKLVQQKKIEGNNLQANELDLTGQPKGFYLLKVQAGDKVFARKIQVN